MHGVGLGEHRTSAGLQGDLGEHHGQIPVLLQHAVSGRLQQVQGLGGWIDQPVFGHLQLPAHSGYRCTKILRTEVVTSGPSIALRDGETTRPMSSSASERGSAGSAVDRQRLAVIAPW